MSDNRPRRRGRPPKAGPREANGRLKRASKPSASKSAPLALPDDLALEVEQLVALGEPQAVIAAAVGCTLEELTARFGVELLHGHARRRREVIGLMFAKARTGNATLIKELHDLTRLVAAERAAEAEQAVAMPARRGKKVEAQEAAETAGVGTEWGDDLGQAPSLN